MGLIRYRTRANLVFATISILAFGLLLFLSRAFSVSGDPADQGIEMPAATVYHEGEESEPNDTMDTADSMGSFWIMDGRIPFTRTLDVDWYRLTLRRSDIGRDYQAALEETGPFADNYLNLSITSAEGAEACGKDGFGDTGVLWVPEVITYYLTVWWNRKPGIDHDIPYELTVHPAPTQTPYPEEPALHLSFREGAPGSLITVTCMSFPDGDQISIWLNGRFIGAVPGRGGGQFQLDTTHADEGLYLLITRAQPVTVGAYFILDADQPLREPIGDGAIFPVPCCIAFTSQQLMPFVANQE